MLRRASGISPVGGVLATVFGLAALASSAQAEPAAIVRGRPVARTAEPAGGLHTARRAFERVGRSLSTAAEMLRVSARATRHLGRPLGLGKLRAIWKAHKVGVGERGTDGKPAGTGTYTSGQLRRKSALLRSAGLGIEARRALIQNGVVGRRRREKEQLADEVYKDDDASFHRREDARRRREGHYSNKGGHKERSIANAPSHKKHWKKEKKRRRNRD